jgi:hypothetical protein
MEELISEQLLRIILTYANTQARKDWMTNAYAEALTIYSEDEIIQAMARVLLEGTTTGYWPWRRPF